MFVYAKETQGDTNRDLGKVVQGKMHLGAKMRWRIQDNLSVKIKITRRNCPVMQTQENKLQNHLYSDVRNNKTGG